MKIKFILVFILLQIIILLLINSSIQNQKNEIFVDSTKKIKTQYRSTINHFHKMANSVFNGYINRPENVEAFAMTERDTLYDLLKPYYKYLQESNFQRIHFISSDNKSFFRLDNPTSFGFNLEKDRYSIVYVNKYHKPIDGIEIGKIVPAFRYLYPIFDGNEYIGVSENSFSIEKFLTQLENTYSVYSHMIILNEVIEKKVIKKIKNKYYSNSYEHKDYYMLKRTNVKVNNIDSFSLLKYKKKINESIHKNESFSLEIKINNLTKIMSFLPIKNIEKKKIAYFVVYSDSKKLEELNKKQVHYTILFIIFSLIILIAIYKQLLNKQLLEKTVKKKTKELANLNKSLKNQIDIEIQKNRKKELALMESYKMVQLGEMIANIAHQWRQPLNTISISASSMLLNYQLNISDKKDNIFKLTKISESSKYLSETINTFRNFLENKKELENQIIQKIVYDSLNIIKTNIQSHHIKIIDNTLHKDKISIKTIHGELSQVIINILNNAKDALVENKVKDPWIKLDLSIKNDNVILNIQDNAGGIQNDIIQKIFDPYFTTKHKSQGTGLGLHMSKRIIEESLNGTLNVKNNDGGALFTICLKESVN